MTSVRNISFSNAENFLIQISYTEAKESQIREHAQKTEALEETCQDYENTINQFRDLVMQLQR